MIGVPDMLMHGQEVSIRAMVSGSVSLFRNREQALGRLPRLEGAELEAVMADREREMLMGRASRY